MHSPAFARLRLACQLSNELPHIQLSFAYDDLREHHANAINVVIRSYRLSISNCTKTGRFWKVFGVHFAFEALAILIDKSGQSEVDQLHVTELIQHEIAQTEVAMNEAARVHMSRPRAMS